MRTQYHKELHTAIKCIWETKPFWKYSFLADGDIVSRWDPSGYNEAEKKIPEGWAEDRKKVFHLIRQIYGQACADNIDLGFVHTYEQWWFFKKTPKDFFISKGFRKTCTNPTVLQCVLFLVNQSSEVQRKNPEALSTAVPTSDGKRQPGNGKQPEKSRQPFSERSTSNKQQNPGKLAEGGASTHTMPRSSDLALYGTDIENICWAECQLLLSNEYMKCFSTLEGAFVKMITKTDISWRMEEIQNEALIYNILHTRLTDKEVVPAFFGFCNIYREPYICLSLEGENFEDIGIENIEEEIKLSALYAMQQISDAGVLHGDIALRNIVVSKSDPRKAKIIDFGRGSQSNKKYLLDGQVVQLRTLLM